MMVERFAQGQEASTGLTIEQKYAVMGVEASQPVSAYANPELWAANLFAAAAEPVSFAENPELMVAGRFAEGSSPASGLTMEQKYAVMGVEVSQPISFYANPELMMVERFAQGQEASTGLTIEQKYAVMGVEVSHPISIYANPEVHFAQRFAGETGAGSQGWAVNPELALAQPYSTPIYSAEFLAVNPEIKQHLGYIQGG
jgi:hypothetical protein